jgi:hypothetical protein
VAPKLRATGLNRAIAVKVEVIDHRGVNNGSGIASGTLPAAPPIVNRPRVHWHCGDCKCGAMAE